jgi:hypothetical protein
MTFIRIYATSWHPVYKKSPDNQRRLLRSRLIFANFFNKYFAYRGSDGACLFSPPLSINGKLLKELRLMILWEEKRMGLTNS